MKLHLRDLTSSNNKCSSYAKSINLISARSTTHWRTHETLDLYFEGVTLSEFIYEGKPRTTKPTFVALPSITSHSTFYEYLRGILCQPQDSPHSPLMKMGVIISYSLHLERKITLPSTSIISTYFTPSQVMNQYTPIWCPQKRKLHLMSRVTSVFNVKSIG